MHVVDSPLEDMLKGHYACIVYIMKPFKFVTSTKQKTYSKLRNLSNYATRAIQVKWRTICNEPETMKTGVVVRVVTIIPKTKIPLHITGASTAA